MLGGEGECLGGVQYEVAFLILAKIASATYQLQIAFVKTNQIRYNTILLFETSVHHLHFHVLAKCTFFKR